MLMSRRIFLFLALTFSSMPLAGQQQGGLPAAKVKEIEQAISSEMSRQNIPGISVAIATDSRLSWSAGFGMADVENFVPAKGSMVHRLGSISKPITAVAVMQLVEKGKLDLDAPIQKYVPSFPQKPWPITARLLLGHLSGIRHYRGAEEMNSTRHYDDRLTPLQIFQSDPLLFEPGAKYSYTTYGFNLLGAAVQGASDMRFVDYLRRYVFEPAGMDRIRPDDVYTIIPNRARGYRKTPSGELQNCALADTSNKIPGGGLTSTPEDLVKLALAVNAGVLLKKETVELMFTRQKTRDGKTTSYRLGWAINEFQGKRRAGHGGGQQGTSTNLSLVPSAGFAVAIMANLEGAALGRLTDQITEIALRP